jgi:hypothetical protein
VAAPASTKPIKVVQQRSGKIVLQVTEWRPARIDSSTYCSTPSEPDLKAGLPGFPKSVKDAVRRRRQNRGLAKGRLVGLYRDDPIRHSEDLVALMDLHLAPKERVMIRRVDLCRHAMDPGFAMLYRQALLECAVAIAREPPWGNGLVAWKVYSEEQAGVIRALGGFRARPTKNRRLRRQIILDLDPD